MAQVSLPYTLTAGTPENVNNLMSNLTALRDGINTVDTAQIASGAVGTSQLASAVGNFSTFSTSWTATLTASTTNPTLGTGNTVVSRYVQIGKLVIAHFIIFFGTSGTNAGSGTYKVSVPVNITAANGSAVVGPGYMYDSSAVKYQPVVWRPTGQSNVYAEWGDVSTSSYNTFSATGPWTWAASDQMGGALIYEAA